MPVSLNTKTLPSLKDILNENVLSSKDKENVRAQRVAIQSILNGTDSRTLCIVGPCSIHMSESGLEYAHKLSELAEAVKDSLYIVFRGYLEKPRTLDGWRGFLFDPDLDGSYNIAKGIEHSRRFLKEIVQMNLPIAYEFVEPMTKQYIQDMVSWGCIGARTCQSPIHRQLASSLSFPVGFKNTTSGDITAAVQAAKVSLSPQHIFEQDIHGQITFNQSSGNPLPHIVLRGSKNGPNYQEESIAKTASALSNLNLDSPIIIDCSHDNCGYIPSKQLKVAEETLKAMKKFPIVRGFMLESFLMEGRQEDYHSTDRYEEAKIRASKVDPCLSFEETRNFLIYAAKEVR